MYLVRLRQQGDTIIEVMLAFSVFAMLAVGSITIMNQGVASAQEALETTLVRQEIDGQAEMLRFLHQSYLAAPSSTAGARFQSIIDNNLNSVGVNPTEFGNKECLDAIPSPQPGVGKSFFIINPQTGDRVEGLKPMKDANAPAYAQLQYNPGGVLQSPYGLWIEAIQGGNSGQPKFIDFHIRACWYSVTSSAPRTLGTIVRLYVPS